MNRKDTRKRVYMVFGNLQNYGRRVLKLSRLKVYENEAQELLDFFAIPILM